MRCNAGVDTLTYERCNVYVYNRYSYTHLMIDNEVVTRIAQKIRATRLEKNMTIQQVATRTHVSKGLLSKIENSRTIPSLPVFVTLIQSLDISLKDFFNDMILVNGREYLLVRKEQMTTQERAESDGITSQYILSQNVPNCTMETILLTLDPGASGKPATTDGFEFRHLLSGSCEYNINGEVLNLEEGDTLYFDATVPHFANNKSRRHVKMLGVCFIVPK